MTKMKKQSIRCFLKNLSDEIDLYFILKPKDNNDFWHRLNLGMFYDHSIIHRIRQEDCSTVLQTHFREAGKPFRVTIFIRGQRRYNPATNPNGDWEYEWRIEPYSSAFIGGDRFIETMEI